MKKEKQKWEVINKMEDEILDLKAKKLALRLRIKDLETEMEKIDKQIESCEGAIKLIKDE